ncbi:diaminopropionate ammonia-lyase [Cryobacterium psychrophilum]|uniref:Diaminopropionate ammonia-lyase n=1 Tax=Cryobacterium psychrophilum TaxID=41988 RepID=A0A4Y8KS75_9MICO|nr:diaminopropionate ammonia-lyase [Cryobacterium psychrophilum]TDW28805.1 diaminopropionate ammonia-lyase [Cryobacterium psychrophilum]TFD82448.1 diaminopropionate ammonia-lyase [Cryobacterium psychrophilum]
MIPTQTTFWYSNPTARSWRTSAPESAVPFHRSLDGYTPTPLVGLPSLAAELGVGQVLLKDESNRLGLPAFKILGASWAVCRALCQRYDLDPEGMTVPRLKGFIRTNVGVAEAPVLVTATDGNHGRAVARMAALLGLVSRIYIPAGLSSSAIDGIRSEGADVVETDGIYDDVVTLAAESTEGEALDVLIQDTAWEGYMQVPQWIVDGYGTLFGEIDDALQELHVAGPDLVVCPVGVGSLAQALVEHYRTAGNAAPALLSSEPDTAACIAQSLLTGKPVVVATTYPSIMSGLNCGTPSELAWPALRAGLDAAVSVSESECRQAVLDLQHLGLDVGPCGAASLAGVRTAVARPERRQQLGLDGNSVIVLVSTEGLAANPLR